MKRTILLALAVLGVAVSSQALQVRVLDTPFNDYPAPQAGEFIIAPVVGGQFTSFCLEMNEQLSFNTLYNAVLNTGAVNGGIAGGNPDPLSIGTAYLYFAFRQGTLAPYNTATLAAHIASAQGLQQAIWWLEDELSLVNPGANPFIAVVQGMFANPKANSGGAYGVGVLNLYDMNRNPKQDVLTVPEGGMTVMLLGFALTALGLIGRKTR